MGLREPSTTESVASVYSRGSHCEVRGLLGSRKHSLWFLIIFIVCFLLQWWQSQPTLWNVLHLVTKVISHLMCCSGTGSSKKYYMKCVKNVYEINLFSKGSGGNDCTVKWVPGRKEKDWEHLLYEEAYICGAERFAKDRFVQYLPEGEKKIIIIELHFLFINSIQYTLCTKWLRE